MISGSGRLAIPPVAVRDVSGCYAVCWDEGDVSIGFRPDDASPVLELASQAEDQMPFIVGSKAGSRQGYSCLMFGAMPADLDGCSKVKALRPLLVVTVNMLADWELSAMMHDLLSRCLCIEVTSALQRRLLRL
jgi:hypothetical protein